MAIKDFFEEIDRLFSGIPKGKLHLNLIGSGALILQFDYVRVTKDADILEAEDLSDIVKNELLKLAGKDSDIFKKHRIYLEFVGRAFPFLPQQPVFHPMENWNQSLQNITISALDVHDVVVSKFKSYRPADLDDIVNMIDLGVVDHAYFTKRLQSAVDKAELGSGAEDIPKIVDRIHKYQRNVWHIEESEVILPAWLERSR